MDVKNGMRGWDGVWMERGNTEKKKVPLSLLSSYLCLQGLHLGLQGRQGVGLGRGPAAELCAGERGREK